MHGRVSLATLLLGLLFIQPVAAQPEDEAIRNSVVKIFTTARMPNLFQPWTRQQPSESTGSGVIIEGNLILTNAHVVNYGRRILVQPHQSSDKYEGEVVAIARGIDLALVKLEDESFFDSHPPAQFTEEMPRIGSTVHAIGYPMGGDALSVTEGIVSRLEFTDYNYDTLGQRLQVDTALNPGNSGGPVFVDNKVVGVVFSGIPSAENIGYVIPTDEINMFLEDIDDGIYEGNPRMFSHLQTAENPALRERLELESDDTGLIVTSADEDSLLQHWDVISAIGEHDIDNRGMVAVDGGFRLHFGYYVAKLGQEGTVPLTLIRGGEDTVIDFPVSSTLNSLQKPLDGDYPSYLIHGPMVFMPTYAEVAAAASRAAGVLSANGNPIITRLGDEEAFEGEQLIVLPSAFFPHRVTKGYSLGILPVLDSVNGESVKNLAHLAELLRDAEGEYIEFRFAGTTNETLVFDRQKLEDSTEDVLDDAGIRSRASDDVFDILTGG
jgi:S1-C subfamily serine protease